jgi:hypothetical protein
MPHPRRPRSVAVTASDHPEELPLRLVRTGVALVVAGIFMFAVRPAINDTTDRAVDTANRASDHRDAEGWRQAGPR